MASQQATVSVSTGVVEPLRRKLESLLRAEPLKLKSGEKKEVESLKVELDSMGSVLHSSAAMDAPDVQVTEWTRQVREVTYDAEDCVDRFLNKAAGKPRSSILSALGRVPRAPSPTRKLSFADQIRQLTARLKEANARRDRYNVSVDLLSKSDATDAAAVDLEPSDVTVHPHLIDMQRAAPVAIDGPTGDVLKLLGVDKKENNPKVVDEENHLKVASIVGMPGIGKTTLAKNLYLRLQESFHCRAFVYAGRRPSVRMVLVDIISQIDPQQKMVDDDVATEHKAITKLRSLLQDKRYLIIVDDILSISAWKAISCALPQNDHGSRIIVTTRIHDVARSCSSHPSDAVHVMKPLVNSDSEALLHRRVRGSEEGRCSDELCIQVHDRVLGVCGGLPMAILVVASFLARPGEPREKVAGNNSTLSALAQCPPVQAGVMKMLHIIYASLPFPLKSCFLYLSAFPQNYEVNKDRLIWRWIGEGFISGRREIGESYFNELINRCLIQPVFADDAEEDDGPVGCKVHGAIHDFIMSLSSEENFVTSDEELESMPRDVIRRLSLNYSRQEDQEAPAVDTGSMSLTQCRSLTFSGSAQWLPPLTNFQLLRVLDLEDAEGLKNDSLEHIGMLFNLKYLGLGGESVTALPDGIGGLQLLETLEMRRTGVRSLPAAAGRLQKLVRLLAQLLDYIPVGVDKVQGLQELSMVSVNSDHSLDFVVKLAKLKQLRMLGLKWCFKGDDATAGDASAAKNPGKTFISSLNGHTESKISSLSIHSDEPLDFLAASMEWVPPYQLQKLVFKGSCSCLPRNLSSCERLTYLEITGIIFQKNSQEAELRAISSLPDLIILKLSARGEPLVIRKGFQCLKVFWFQRPDEGALGLIFEAGAMTQLRKLSLHFKALSQPQPQPQIEEQQVRFVPQGLQHLSSSLKQVNVKIDCGGATLTKVASVEDTIKKEVSATSKVIKLKLSRNNEQEMERQDDGARRSNASQRRGSLMKLLSAGPEEINKSIGG